MMQLHVYIVNNYWVFVYANILLKESYLLDIQAQYKSTKTLFIVNIYNISTHDFSLITKQTLVNYVLAKTQ